MALQLRRNSSAKVRIITTLMMVFALVAQPLYGFVSARIVNAAPVASTISVTGNTAPGENQPGWMFNRDLSTSTPFEFNASAYSIGTGSLYVKPIGASAADKFVAENFLMKPISEISNISYDFKIGSLVNPTDYKQFYMNVYANFGGAPATKFYDCRYNVVPMNGNTASFTTVTFDPTQNYTVTTSGSSTGGNCPASPAAMGSGATIRAFALNLGDTSASDAGLNGYFDNVKVNTTTSMVYDFEPFVPATPANLRFNDTGVCGGATNVNYVTPKWNAVAGAASYEYKVNLPNGGQYGPVNLGNVTSVSGPFGAEGTSAFSVRAIGTNGLASEWAPFCAVTYDATMPAKVTLTTPVDNSYQTVNDFYFKWNGVTGDTGSTVHYEFQSSQSASKDANGVLNSSVWKNVDSTNPEQKYLDQPQIHSTGANGTWYWQARAVDAAGNVGQWSDVWKITIDQDAPQISLTSPANNAFVNGGSLTQSWSSTSADVKRYIYESYNDSAMTQVRFTQDMGLQTSKTAANVGNAVFWWRVKAVDNAGHATWSELRKITVDNNKPTAQIKFAAIGDTFIKVKFNENVNKDDAENAANYFLENWPGAGGSGDLGGDASVVYDAPTTTATVTFTNAGWAVSPEQKWGVRNIRDLAGNVLNETYDHSTPMTNPTVLSVDGVAIGKDIVWTWSANDPNSTHISGATGNSSVSGYQYRLIKGTDAPQSWISTANNTITTTTLSDDTYTLQVRAYDRAGNTSTDVSSNPVTVDATAPELTINAPVQNLDGTYRVSGTTTDVDQPITVKVNGNVIDDQVMADADGTWTVGLGALTADTQYVITANTKDAAGNEAEQEEVNFTTPAIAVIPLANVTGTLAPLSQARTVATNNANAVNQSEIVADDTAVLGAQTTNEKSGASDITKNVAAIAPSANGWQLFNLAWYWWLLILAAIVGAIWWIAARRQNAQ